MPSLPPHKFTVLIVDIGDVLLSWSSLTKTNIPSKTLHRILSSSPWSVYERGGISQDTCYKRISEEFCLPLEDIAAALEQARQSLKPNYELISLIRELKARSGGALRVFAMSNMPSPDYHSLHEDIEAWGIFDELYMSCNVRERKPHLGFYKYVISHAHIEPEKAIFIDDKPDNVLSARSLGIYGIIFDDCQKVVRELRNLLGDPVHRGEDFLLHNAGKLESITNTNVAIYENFTQLLILELTDNKDLIKLSCHTGAWNFFREKPVLTTEDYPFDLDTTSLALCITNTDHGQAMRIMDNMLEYMDADGIIQTYFDHQRPRFDPVVCTNVLTLFYSYGRSAELTQTFNWVHAVLYHRAYLDGTRYYTTPECFLYFLTRLLAVATPSDASVENLRYLLEERTKERIGLPGDALALAMRLITCACVGIDNPVDRKSLLQMQCDDGGWEIGWIYRYGVSGIKVGNRGLTTAFAMKALK